ncbi:acyl-CoA thioesterase [Propioniferax innocua]|uniref:Acyl-CoA thioester hydrolase n=1 Tax=Propioniferax innocua TaxID=1753 RepID=A0A542ZRL1_9ACTN|nr:thioesterase family protein [Propioniferax innocua]TQL62972.1 acyl-CoA thioester hydrolase [Propioniferax innocua]
MATAAFTHHAQIRWGDIDQLGHMNNVVFIDLLQQARALWWQSTPAATDLLGPTDGPDGPVGTVVAELQVEWKRPIFLGQQVEVRLGTTQVGAARFTIWYEIIADKEVACLARSLMAVVALRTGRILRIPAGVGDYLRSVSGEPDALRPLARADGPEPDDPERMHRFEVESRWSDVDAYGHINNAQYFELFQEARIGFIDEVDALRDMVVVVARSDLRYREQAPFRSEPYTICSAVTRVGSSSFDMRAILLRDKDDQASVLAEQWVTLVRIDAEGRPKPLSVDESAALMGA